MSEQPAIPDDRRYTAEHEWIRQDGDAYTVGITAFAQDQLGDIVYVELPNPGAQLTAGDTFGVVESVKTASDLYAPVSGEVLQINELLKDQPQLVNETPYDDGWMLKLRVTDAAALDVLLTAQQYAEQIGS